MSDQHLPGASLQAPNPWATNTDPSPPESESSVSVVPPAVITRVPSALYYCRYLEDDGPRLPDDSMADYHIFGEQDLINSIDILDSKVLPETPNGDQRNDIGRDSPSETITISNPSEENNDLEKITFSQEARLSRFRERLSLDDISIPNSMFTSIDLKKEEKEHKEFTKFHRVVYIYIPWAIRFTFIFFLANWWALTPLMKATESGSFHSENLPIVYSCGMLSIIAVSLGLQGIYFRSFGAPWTIRKRVKQAENAAKVYEGQHQMTSASEEPIKETNNRNKTGTEIYIFVIDLVLLTLALALLRVSIVIARAGALRHEAYLRQHNHKIPSLL
ncbi:hypothetical protein H072_6012 [Dactylellina haptotyla CBS 200.50]|uniref:Uncharacterized protein n=1 Tax=Dactylellina haptotyla (strain CBS 200.50) TaxID=1284197 RepID=S8ABB4_DACHA|nr:hypothetical protein H072_6012 [Dactylellina haptotyla CBS 200.50]